MSTIKTHTVGLSQEDEEKVIAIHDLLEEGKSRSAAKMILDMRNKFFKSILDYRPMFRKMKELKQSDGLTLSYMHHCGDKTIINFIKGLRAAKTEDDIECLFMTSEGGCECPRSQVVRVRNTDLFTHYLECLYEMAEESRCAVAV